MPTYEYECKACGFKFEQQQSIKEPALTQCPQCQGEVRRLISGGTGYILKGSGHGQNKKQESGCSFESSGTTCCGRKERCGEPACGDEK